jgi:hypothetical protein
MRVLLVFAVIGSSSARADRVAFEATLGVGRAGFDGAGDGAGNTVQTSGFGASTSVAAGGWIANRLALTASAAINPMVVEYGATIVYSLGPRVVFRVHDRVWISAGASVAINEHGSGHGYDARLGFPVSQAFSVALSVASFTVPNDVNPELMLGDDTFQVFSVQLVYHRRPRPAAQ